MRVTGVSADHFCTMSVGAKVIAAGHSDKAAIESSLAALNAAWDALLAEAVQRHSACAGDAVTRTSAPRESPLDSNIKKNIFKSQNIINFCMASI